ncbi:hypothetical protein V2J09_004707 [Rumex salicifolius]
MRRITGVRNALQLIPRRFRDLQHRPFCDSTSSAEKGKRLTSNSSNGKVSGNGDIRDLDVYRDLDKLDFMKAAKILFTHPPKKKKFGLDFHLVQLFFVCMPSLAVYLVAQYARYEMRRMDAELEVKKKAEEEAKEKEEAAVKEKEGQSASELLEVKERLIALEKTVHEIAAEKGQTIPTVNSSGKSQSHSSNAAAKDQTSMDSDPKQISRSVTDDKEKSQNAESANMENTCITVTSRCALAALDNTTEARV